MNILREAWAEFIGLFVDDGLLAITILAVVAIALVLTFGLHAASMVTAAVLVVGCFGALVASVWRGARKP